MSVDSRRLQSLVPYLHNIWSAPLQIFLAFVVLWDEIGVSSLGGVAIMLIMVPVNMTIARCAQKMQKQVMQVRDERVAMAGELLGTLYIATLKPEPRHIFLFFRASVRHCLAYPLGVFLSPRLKTQCRKRLAGRHPGASQSNPHARLGRPNSNPAAAQKLPKTFCARIPRVDRDDS